MTRLFPTTTAPASSVLLPAGCRGPGTGGSGGRQGSPSGSASSSSTRGPTPPARVSSRRSRRAGARRGDNPAIDLQNASGDQGASTTVASTPASSDADLVLAIATPAAQSVTDRPVLFTAATDPIEAGPADSPQNPGGSVTGTTDMHPVAEQIALIEQLDRRRILGSIVHRLVVAVALDAGPDPSDMTLISAVLVVPRLQILRRRRERQAASEAARLVDDLTDTPATTKAGA